MSEIRKEKSRLNSLTGSRKDIGSIEKSKDSESLHESQKRVNIIELEAESKKFFIKILGQIYNQIHKDLSLSSR